MTVTVVKTPAKTARRVGVEAEVRRRRKRRGWTPFAGPQMDAYLAAQKVDVLGYGGAGGGGKTDLDLALAYLQHRRTIVYRRTIPQLAGIEERAKEIFDKRGKYNEQRKMWRLRRTCDPAGRRLATPVSVLIQFASMNRLEDREKSRGVPFDGRIFDEAQNFLRDQVMFVMAWTRTSVQGQHCCDVMSFNPPTSPEGLWLIEYFAPWIDEAHVDRAQPGEVRWFITLADGKEKEIDGPRDWRSPDFVRPDPIVIDDREFIPRSRTFFPALATDNPALMKTGYMAVLDALPEPLRSQMRDGDFTAGLEDADWQLIPTAWAKLAIARGKVTPRPTMQDGTLAPWTAIGGDLAAGGADLTVFSQRAGDWYAPLLVYPGSQTPDGATAAKFLLDAMGGVSNLVPNLDVIGIGEGIKTALNMLKVKYVGLKVGTSSYDVAKGSGLRFKNLKAEIYWRFREALDPEGGRDLSLPDDRELLADLCAIRFEYDGELISIEDKEDTKKRHGVGLHRAEAVMFANYVAPRSESTKNPWAGR